METNNKKEFKSTYKEPVLSILKKERFTKNEKWGKINHDITITKTIEKREYNKDGTITIKKEEEKTNLTRKINETAKVLKNQTAKEKLLALTEQISNSL